MYVDGNAESISYDKKSDGQYQQNQTISARIKITFEDKEISIIKEVKGVEGTFSPPNKVAKEGILTGFIWKPEFRPKSKNDIVNIFPDKNQTKPKTTTVKPKTAPKTTNKPDTKPASTTKKANENTGKANKPSIKIDSNKVNTKTIVPIVKADTSKKNR